MPDEMTLEKVLEIEDPEEFIKKAMALLSKEGDEYIEKEEEFHREKADILAEEGKLIREKEEITREKEGRKEDFASLGELHNKWKELTDKYWDKRKGIIEEKGIMGIQNEITRKMELFGLREHPELTELSHQASEKLAAIKGLEEKLRDIISREKALAAREKELSLRKANLGERELNLERWKDKLMKRANRLRDRYHELRSRAGQ